MFNLESLTREYLESLRARELYQIAREIKVLRYTRFKKQELIDAILDLKEGNTTSQEPEKKESKPAQKPPSKKTTKSPSKKETQEEEKGDRKEKDSSEDRETKNETTETKPEQKTEPQKETKTETKTTTFEEAIYAQEDRPQNHKEDNRQSPQRHVGESKQARSQQQDHSSYAPHDHVPSKPIARGVLDVHVDGYGFLRSPKYIPDTSDIYVHPSLIKKLGLRPGDYIEGRMRNPRNEKEKYSALTTVDSINKAHPTSIINRPRFEDLIPIFPLERFRLSASVETANITNRLIELIAPLGKGQRGLIVSPPKAGKTTVIKRIAQGIAKNNPEAYLMILLIDERPEEVTDMKRSVKADIISSTFDQLPENHIRVVELAINRAKRLVEMKKDVVILLDGITRLTRAYNLSCTPSGRTLTGGLDTAAIHGPKKFLGAARNIDGGGSLTILATALIETGSKMDEIIYEEFKGTGNMELVLERKLSEKRVFPALDISRSSTRREELLYEGDELRRIWMVRKFLSNLDNSEALERLIKWMKESPSNEKFLESISLQQPKTNKV
ncbi:MAG: transcription termination factor Rho [Caldisericia bacterium]|nr:transcription termination factor Rho [Caldisericia bacterium]